MSTHGIVDFGTVLKKTDGSTVTSVDGLTVDEAKKARQLIWRNIRRLKMSLATGRYGELGVDQATTLQWEILMFELDAKLKEDDASMPYAEVLGKYKKQIDEDAKAAQVPLTPSTSSNFNVTIFKAMPTELEKYNMSPWLDYIQLSLAAVGAEKAIQTPLDENDLLNKYARHLIWSTVPSELRFPIIGMSVAFEMINVLKDNYGKPSYQQVRVIEKELRAIQLTKYDEESVKKALQMVVKKIQILKCAGIDVSYELMCDRLAAFLPVDQFKIKLFEICD